MVKKTIKYPKNSIKDISVKVHLLKIVYNQQNFTKILVMEKHMRAKQEGVRATQPIALALQKKKNTKLKMCAIRNDIEIRKLKGNSPRKAMVPA